MLATIRLRLIAIVILAVGAIFLGRLYTLQVIHGDAYAAEGERQYVATVPNLYDRGTIFMRQKDGELVAAATISSGYLIAIDPRVITDPEMVYERLSSVITLDRNEFFAKAGRVGDPYEEIASRVNEDDKNKILALNILGVAAYRQTWRYYPGKAMAARTIGFVGYKGDELVGRYGIESYYNDTLRREGEGLYVNFFAEIFSGIGSVIFDREAETAGDLILTLEPTVESMLEEELSGIMKEWQPRETGGVIMDPSTGAIRAMAVLPAFDLNRYNKVEDPALYTNPLVESVYEMGSIVKPLTIAAGLDAGVITAESIYDDKGTLTVNGRTIANFDRRGRGPNTSMQQVLNESLNTGAAHVVSLLGNQRFAEYFLERYRIGDETGIDLPGERQGMVANLSSRRDVEYVTASFGQGIAMSPIAVITALATLANGGKTVSPHLVQEIRYESGRRKVFSPNPPEEVLRRETSEEITRMLVTVVDKALLGGTVRIPEYSVAAKTGTAQIARPRAEGGGYYDDRYFHTFFGYFPAYDPKFIVFLYAYDPKNAGFASHTLTHPFMRITKFLLHYYDIPPDRVPSDGRGTTRLHHETID